MPAQSTVLSLVTNPPAEHRRAPASRSSSSSFAISWGLLHIPVSLFPATAKDEAGVKRKECVAFGDTYHEVGKRPYDKQTGETLDPGTTVTKRAPSTDGIMVELTDEEIVQVTQRRKGVALIECIFPVEALGTDYLVESVGYVRPQKRQNGKVKVVDPAAEEAFALLLAGLEAEGCCALMKLATRGPARWVALTPDGRLLTLFFAEQVRPVPARTEREFSEALLTGARQLIKTMGTEIPVLVDDAGAALQAHLDAKAAGITPKAAVAEEFEAPVDLMAAIRASLAAAEAA